MVLQQEMGLNSVMEVAPGLFGMRERMVELVAAGMNPVVK